MLTSKLKKTKIFSGTGVTFQSDCKYCLLNIASELQVFYLDLLAPFCSFYDGLFI